MAHEKFRNTLTFTDQFGKLLKLSPEQIKAIDNLDYEHARSYMFNVPEYPFKNEREARLAYRNKILDVLHPDQRRLLEEHAHKEQARQLQQEAKEAQREKAARADRKAYLLRRYKSLKLTPGQADLFTNILIESREEATRAWREERPPGVAMDCEEEAGKLAERQLKDVLGETQLKKFRQVFDKLLERSREADRKWQIKQTLIEYKQLQGIDLTPGQAEAIANFKNGEQGVDEQDNILSFWEETAREEDLMRRVLTESQLATYLKGLEAQRAAYTQHLEASERRKLQDINAARQRFDYAAANTLPMLVAFRQALDGHLALADKQQLERIRQACLEALDRELALSEKENRRHNGPYINEYIEAQWRAAHRAVLPDSDLLRDSPLFPVLQSLARKYAAPLEAIIDFEKLRAANQARQEFAVKNYEENGGLYGGFVMVIRTESSDAELRMATDILLLSPELEANLEEARKRQPGG
ncbi:MAG: hypothetical protein AVDCRST_MAG56-3623 [uncultured Cytophagales bacterium]|uniref:Uncharacterized protein n=1 Tax=uncultured Cytophagales bacterium TaxID=158755 RepID=A0A6J4JK11_9SPHI|nr:MAG: hypothetical protein AVDCRST_MAG56-3623 [uncultured Cytophagales bacterium]